MQQQQEESKLEKEHLPCPDCGSSDAMSLYSDGHTYCFSCKQYRAEGRATMFTAKDEDKPQPKNTIKESDMLIESLKARGIKQETCRKYGYFKTRVRGKLVQVASYYDDAKQLIGQKVRQKNKEFYTLGNSFSTRFFGQHLWANGHRKMLIITEGEIDCLTVSQINGNNAVIDAIWNAKEYTPDGIVNGKDLWERVSEEEIETGYDLPWSDIPINNMIHGFRKGELVVLTAGTGVGKSTFIRQIAYDFGVKKKLKIGMLMLEENVKRTARGLMSVHVGKRLYMDRHAIDEKAYHKAFEETLGTGRYVMYEHFGSLDGDNLMNKIRYMAIAEECDFIILDHISIAISGLSGDNERKMIDMLMTQLRSLAEETGVGLLIISHLRRATGRESTPFEEGGTTSLSQLRGSGAIGQLADTVIGLERNQQAEGKAKNLVKLRVLKCRWTGETGIAGHLFYDKDKDNLIGAPKLKDIIGDEDIEEGEYIADF